jgi:hypothetical protein
MPVLRVHGLSPGERSATLIMSLCTSIPATRSYGTFICAATSCSGKPPSGWDRRAAGQSPGQYRRLTHAHAAATGVTREGALGPDFQTASNGPRVPVTADSTPAQLSTFRASRRQQNKARTSAAASPHHADGGRGPSYRFPRQRHAVANDFFQAIAS